MGGGGGVHSFGDGLRSVVVNNRYRQRGDMVKVGKQRWGRITLCLVMVILLVGFTSILTVASVKGYLSTDAAVTTGTASACPHHDVAWSDVTLKMPATCTTDGREVLLCRRCNGTWSRSIAALGHHYVDKIIAPGCEHGGYTLHTCQRCDHQYQTNPTPATGHTYSSQYVAPNCETNGGTLWTCDHCGQHHTTDPVPALGHTYGDWVTIGLDADGMVRQLGTCTRCHHATQERTIFPYTHRLTITGTNGDLTLNLTVLTSLATPLTEQDFLNCLNGAMVGTVVLDRGTVRFYYADALTWGEYAVVAVNKYDNDSNHSFQYSYWRDQSYITIVTNFTGLTFADTVEQNY